MVSPLVELSLENLSGKAFRFGIFRAEFRPSKVALTLVLQRKLAGFGGAAELAPIRGGEAGRVMQLLFCEPGLGRLGSGWPPA